MHRLTIWLNYLVKCFFFSGSLILSSRLMAQTLTLDEVISKATAQYPLLKQKDFINQTAQLSINNLNKSFWPQASLNGQASYQSDVTSLTIPLPGVTMNPLQKDQYRIFADISQVVYDGGLVSHQKKIEGWKAVVEDQKVEVEVTALRDRLTQIYLGILLTDRQIQQISLIKEDLLSGIRWMEAQLQQGAVLRSQLQVLQAEELRTEQRLTETQASRKALVETLGLYLNQNIADPTVFSVPPSPVISTSEINRPELTLLNGQKEMVTEQAKIINARNCPRTSAFLQAGYGRPGLNMLKNSFEPFYIAGIKINWTIGNLYTAKSEKKILEINNRTIDLQKEVFILQTTIKQKQQLTEIAKWEQFIRMDTAIIALRKDIRQVAKAQLENGSITTSDYLREVNAEDAARQNLILHELQLLLARINYANITGSNHK